LRPNLSSRCGLQRCFCTCTVSQYTANSIGVRKTLRVTRAHRCTWFADPRRRRRTPRRAGRLQQKRGRAGRAAAVDAVRRLRPEGCPHPARRGQAAGRRPGCQHGGQPAEPRAVGRGGDATCRHDRVGCDAFANAGGARQDASAPLQGCTGCVQLLSTLALVMHWSNCASAGSSLAQACQCQRKPLKHQRRIPSWHLPVHGEHSAARSWSCAAPQKVALGFHVRPAGPALARSRRPAARVALPQGAPPQTREQCSSCPPLRALTVSSLCSRASRDPHIDVGDLPERSARLTRLSALAMEGCGIASASALGGCSALETLSLRGQECSRQKDATRPAAWPPRLRALQVHVLSSNPVHMTRQLQSRADMPVTASGCHECLFC